MLPKNVIVLPPRYLLVLMCWISSSGLPPTSTLNDDRRDWGEVTDPVGKERVDS